MNQENREQSRQREKHVKIPDSGLQKTAWISILSCKKWRIAIIPLHFDWEKFTDGIGYEKNLSVCRSHRLGRFHSGRAAAVAHYEYHLGEHGGGGSDCRSANTILVSHGDRGVERHRLFVHSGLHVSAQIPQFDPSAGCWNAGRRFFPADPWNAPSLAEFQEHGNTWFHIPISSSIACKRQLPRYPWGGPGVLPYYTLLCTA